MSAWNAQPWCNTDDEVVITGPMGERIRIDVDHGDLAFTRAILARVLAGLNAWSPPSEPSPGGAGDEPRCEHREPGRQCIRGVGHQGGHWFEAGRRYRRPPRPPQ